MYKGRAVDYGNDVLAEQPLAVMPIRAKRLAQREIAGRESAVEPRTQGLRITVITFSPGLQPAITHFLCLVAGERRVFGFADVAQVAGHVHRLVIADKHVDMTACCLRLALKAHQEIHRIAGARSAIEYVADDYEMRIAARPGEVVVHDVDIAQRFDHRLVCTMYIRNSDDPLHTVNLPVIGKHRRANENSQEQAGNQVLRHSEQSFVPVRRKRLSLVTMLDFDHLRGGATNKNDAATIDSSACCTGIHSGIWR